MDWNEPLGRQSSSPHQLRRTQRTSMIGPQAVRGLCIGQNRRAFEATQQYVRRSECDDTHLHNRSSHDHLPHSRICRFASTPRYVSRLELSIPHQAPNIDFTELYAQPLCFFHHGSTARAISWPTYFHSYSGGYCNGTPRFNVQCQTGIF